MIDLLATRFFNPPISYSLLDLPWAVGFVSNRNEMWGHEGGAARGTLTREPVTFAHLAKVLP